MNTTVLISFFIGQFIIQAVLYYTLIRWLINKHLSKLMPSHLLIKVLPVAMVIENLGIIVIVMLFTSAGASAGMTNLLASVLLGVLMAIDCKVLLKGQKQKVYKDDNLDEYFIK